METVEGAIRALEGGDYTKLKEIVCSEIRVTTKSLNSVSFHFIFIQSARSKADSEIVEFLQSLSKKQTDRLWLGLLQACGKTLRQDTFSFEAEDVEDEDKAADTVRNLLASY